MEEMSTKKVFDEIRRDDLAHDPWGTSMAWHFALCDVMTEWAPPYPPAEWGYRQGAGGVDEDSFAYQTLTEMVEYGEIDADDLLHVGKVLHRFENVCKLAGRDY